MSKEEINFSWVQTHKQIVEYLSTKQNAQVELIELLKSVGITGFNDEDPEGNRIELKEIDPFSFFCFIYKYGSVKRLKLLQKIAEKLNISIPSDEIGIPSANAQKVCLFPFKYSRNNNEIDRLWTFFFSALEDSITDDKFSDIITIKSTGLTKLTEALFNILPEKYFPINRQSKPFLSEKFEINPKFKTYSEYLKILNQLREKSKKPFYELSYDAWYENQENAEDTNLAKSEKEVIKRFKAISRPYLINDYLDIVNEIFRTITPSGIKDPVIALTIPKGNKRIALTISGRYIIQLEGKMYPELGFIATKSSKISDSIETKNQSSFNPAFKGEKAPDYIVIQVVDKLNLPEKVKAIILSEAKKEYNYRYDTGLDELKNPALYKCVNDLDYRQKILNEAFPEYKYNEEEMKFYLLGASWDNEDQTDSFVKDGKWLNGYKEKYLEKVKSVQPGDHVAIKSSYTRGKSKSVMKIKARGVVQKNLNDGKELIVDWEPNFTRFEVGFGGYRSTIHQLIDPLQIKEIYGITFSGNKQMPQIFNNLNIILYGPPGTGKTYNTILKAAEIIEGKTIIDYSEAKQIFNNNLGDRIEFITFHQNYSYEDFIQGLRPDTEQNDSLTFEKKDGVFKRLSINALFEYYRTWKQQTSNSTPLDTNEIYLDFIQYLKVGKEKIFKSSTGVDIRIDTINKNNNIEFRSKNSIRTYLVSGKRLLKLFEAYPEIKKIKNISNDIRDVIGGCNATVYWVALKEFIDFHESHAKEGISSDEETYDEIGYDSKVKLLSTVGIDELSKIKASEVSRYVLIIDEINRANISRVFGELITLIEPDKRSHGAVPLKTTLPSGDEFIVPSNLYIIGTMNTADKSIALLDIALRRRFEFEAMYPIYEISGHKIHDVEILKKINKKIIDLKGHDFQIGHSYFMGGNTDLVERMNKKVIPLLLEYFMNDEKEVKGILNHAGLEIEEDVWPIRITGKRD